MVSYFECDDRKWRGRPRITLPVKLDDLNRAACGRLQSLEDLERLIRRSCSSKRMEAAIGYDLRAEVSAMKPRCYLFPRSRKYRSIHFKHSIHKGFTATVVFVVFMSPISTASLTMSSISVKRTCGLCSCMGDLHLHC